jgi:hypothetical protein
MKAIIIIEAENYVADAEREKLRLAWKKFAADGFSSPLVLSHATVKVLYVPDNFTDANAFTPEEAEAILKQIASSELVVM